MSELIDFYLEAWDELTAPGQRFAMSDGLVDGLPMRTFDAGPPSLRHLWEATARFGDRDYLVYEDERFTFAEAHAIVRKWRYSGYPMSGSARSSPQRYC